MSSDRLQMFFVKEHVKMSVCSENLPCQRPHIEMWLIQQAGKKQEQDVTESACDRNDFF